MCNFLRFFPLIVQICANFFSFKKPSKFTLILLTLIFSSSIWVAQDTDLLLLMKDKTKPETPIEFKFHIRFTPKTLQVFALHMIPTIAKPIL